MGDWDLFLRLTRDAPPLVLLHPQHHAGQLHPRLLELLPLADLAMQTLGPFGQLARAGGHQRLQFIMSASQDGLGFFLDGDIPVDAHQTSKLSPRVAQRAGVAIDNKQRPVFSSLPDLRPVFAGREPQPERGLPLSVGDLGPQDLRQRSAERFHSRPPIKLLGRPVPRRYDEALIRGHNRVRDVFQQH